MRAAVIVAHPDDETLWSGGTILIHDQWQWTVASVCRAADPDRAPKFLRAVAELGAVGAIGDLDDSAGQPALPDQATEQAVLSLLPEPRFDLVLTHGPCGEYTRHRRHEEICRAVLALWADGRLTTDALWMFAYDDDGGRRLPRAAGGADCVFALPERIWQKKYRIITETYGFGEDSFEARAVPREEAFWRFDSPASARDRIRQTMECET